MRHSTTWIQIALLAGVSAGSVAGQDDSRLAEIAAQQQQKAAEARPHEPGKVERTFLRIKEDNWVERFGAGWDGLTPKFGGLAPGSGLALGATYRRGDLMNGRLSLTTSASSSFRGDRKLDLELTAPKLAGGRVFTTLFFFFFF
jgi:hypothetical protein